jgi:hypothetical protein
MNVKIEIETVFLHLIQEIVDLHMPNSYPSLLHIINYRNENVCNNTIYVLFALRYFLFYIFIIGNF